MSYQFISTEIQERLGLITLNRVDKRNALNAEFVSELKSAINSFLEDSTVKVIIIKANGTVFSAGADLAYLKQLQQNSYNENLADSKHLMELFQLIYTAPKIVISQVEGHAIAGGCGLATVCDFCFSTPEAMMGYTEVKIGFIPAIVLVFLLRKLSETKAKELLLTGKLISAEEAKSIGLIYEVLPKESIQDKVIEFAKALCLETSSESLKRTKEMISKVQSMDIEDALSYAAEMNAQSRATKDCQKGIGTFLSKEKIKW